MNDLLIFEVPDWVIKIFYTLFYELFAFFCVDFVPIPMHPLFDIIDPIVSN